MNYNSRKRGQMLEPTKGEKKPKTKPSAIPHSRFFSPLYVSVLTRVFGLDLIRTTRNVCFDYTQCY